MSLADIRRTCALYFCAKYAARMNKINASVATTNARVVVVLDAADDIVHRIWRSRTFSVYTVWGLQPVIQGISSLAVSIKQK